MQSCFNIKKKCNTLPKYKNNNNKNTRASQLTEKVFDKIRYSFMIKMLNRLRMETDFLNLIKNLYEKSTVTITLSGKI